MNKVAIWACSLMLVSGVAAAADIYKWKDADGKIRYSDMPPAGKTAYEKLSGSKPASATAAAAPEAKTEKGAAGGGAGKDKAGAESPQGKSDQAQQDEKKVRDENCAIAKANAQSYKQGGRLYKTNEKGERLYLDEKEIAASLEKANKDVDYWCGQ